MLQASAAVIKRRDGHHKKALLTTAQQEGKITTHVSPASRPTARAPRSGHATAAPPSMAKNFSASDVARCDPPVGGHSYNGGRYHASSRSRSEAVVSTYFPVCHRKRTSQS